MLAKIFGSIEDKCSFWESLLNYVLDEHAPFLRSWEYENKTSLTWQGNEESYQKQKEVLKTIQQKEKTAQSGTQEQMAQWGYKVKTQIN